MKVVIPDSCLACIPVYVNLPANTFHRKRVEKNLIQEKGIIKHNSAQRYIFIKFHPMQKRNQYGYFKIRNNYGATLISLISVEVGINVEGVQKLPNH